MKRVEQKYSSQFLKFSGELCSITVRRQQQSENGVGRRRRGAKVWLRPRSVCARNIELIGSPNRRWEWAPLTVDCLCFVAPPQSSTNAVDGETAPPDPQQELQGEKMLFALYSQRILNITVCLAFILLHWFTSFSLINYRRVLLYSLILFSNAAIHGYGLLDFFSCQRSRHNGRCITNRGNGWLTLDTNNFHYWCHFIIKV